MKSFTRLLNFVALTSGAILVQLASPVEAATFDFASPASSNDSLKSYLDNSIYLEVSNSNSTGNNIPNNNTLNTRPDGLCAWSAAGTSGQGRCGYGNATNSGISGFTFKFDKPTTITSFEISSFQTAVNPTTELTQGSIEFSLDNLVFSPVNFNSTGVKSFSFFAPANQLVYVKTTGTFTAENTLQTGEIRLRYLTTTEPSPAPLPIIGAAVGFRFSRQIRKRIGLDPRRG
jgi:hypothetical protein